MSFREYLQQLFDGVPGDVYLLLLAVFCISAMVLLSFRGARSGGRGVLVVLLAEYVFLLYCSTIIFRGEAERGHNFVPFWSYLEIYHGDDLYLLPQNIMNVLVFVPLGLLLGAAFRSMNWWKAGVIGCAVSVLIEILQYVFKRGFSEFDDVFHNVLGCMIGYAISVVVAKYLKVRLLSNAE